ncbi:MAG TPA: hypothetical protein EYM71_05095 [Rhodospirillales bacterium]|nr:hypothetical protein [Rhodospirillales bacterium]
MQLDNKAFYADLFTKFDTPTPEPGRQLVPAAPVVPVAAVNDETPPAPEQAAQSTKSAKAVRALPAAKEPAGVGGGGAAKAVLKVRSAIYELIGDVDTHHLSPRQMSELSLDLYAIGAISFEDYSALAFQPELHPDFDRTIGALTGERADPDRPRDFVRLWDDRADFQRRHNAARTDLVEQSERIASVLRQIETPISMVV